jgi:hypothetical protein
LPPPPCKRRPCRLRSRFFTRRVVVLLQRGKGAQGGTAADDPAAAAAADLEQAAAAAEAAGATGVKDYGAIQPAATSLSGGAPQPSGPESTFRQHALKDAVRAAPPTPSGSLEGQPPADGAGAGAGAAASGKCGER